MTGLRKRCLLLFILTISCIVHAAADSGEERRLLTISPDRIQIGSFYNGAEVKVSADVASCDGAAIVLAGNEDRVELNRKGRIAVIWMNVARISISGLPGVYILACSDSLDNICSREMQAKLRLGVVSLETLAEFHSDQPLAGNEFDEFLKLKVHNGTYNMNNEIELKSSSAGKLKLSSVLPIPSVMPPGRYDIQLYCFRQGELIYEETSNVEIERIGLPRFMMDLANKHAAVYGLLAIVAAMVFGVVMGIVFSYLPGGRRRY